MIKIEKFVKENLFIIWLIIVFILGLAFILSLWFIYRIEEILSSIILWFTALVVLLYTKETHLLRRTEQEQLYFEKDRYLSDTAPFIVPVYQREDNKISSSWNDYRIPIENKNSCFAFDIKVFITDKEGKNLNIIQDRNCLGKNDKMDISFQYGLNVQKLVPIEIKITYKNFDKSREFITKAKLIEAKFDDGSKGVQIILDEYDEVKNN